MDKIFLITIALSLEGMGAAAQPGFESPPMLETRAKAAGLETLLYERDNKLTRLKKEKNERLSISGIDFSYAIFYVCVQEVNRQEIINPVHPRKIAEVFLRPENRDNLDIYEECVENLVKNNVSSMGHTPNLISATTESVRRLVADRAITILLESAQFFPEEKAWAWVSRLKNLESKTQSPVNNSGASRPGP